jgi:hypothetical protein
VDRVGTAGRSPIGKERSASATTRWRASRSRVGSLRAASKRGPSLRQRRSRVRIRDAVAAGEDPRSNRIDLRRATIVRSMTAWARGSASANTRSGTVATSSANSCRSVGLPRTRRGLSHWVGKSQCGRRSKKSISLTRQAPTRPRISGRRTWFRPDSSGRLRTHAGNAEDARAVADAASNAASSRTVLPTPGLARDEQGAAVRPGRGEKRRMRWI